MEVAMKNTDIHQVLAGLKLLESDRTTAGEWAIARSVQRLHTSLYKQVFEYTEQEEQDD